MRQSYVAKRTIFRIWNVTMGEWWSPEYAGNRAAGDLYFRRGDAERKVASEERGTWRKKPDDLVVVECDLVPKDPFYRELLERQQAAKEAT